MAGMYYYIVLDWYIGVVQRHGPDGDVPPRLPQRGGEAADPLRQPLPVPGIINEMSANEEGGRRLQFAVPVPMTCPLREESRSGRKVSFAVPVLLRGTNR